MYLPYQYVLEERGRLYLVIDKRGRSLLCFNRHKSEIMAETLKETDGVRHVDKILGLAERISFHCVQNVRKCSNEVLS